MSEALILDDYPPDLTRLQELEARGDDQRVEMTNLYEQETGVAGVIYISSRVHRHGPRVKYWVRHGSDERGFSASIADEPRILANSLSPRDLNKTAPAVLAWISLNREALLRFWNEGEDWSAGQVYEFTLALKKV